MTPRSAPRRRSESWARLAADWYTDPVLVAASEVEPAVMVVWPVLVGMAKGESHADTNPTGTVPTTAQTIAAACRLVTAEQVTQALDVLAEGELLAVERGKLGALRVTLTRFVDWQTPRGSKAERDEVHRYGVDGSRAGKTSASGDAKATRSRHTGESTPTNQHPARRAELAAAEQRAPRSPLEAAEQGKTAEWRHAGDATATEDRRLETGESPVGSVASLQNRRDRRPTRAVDAGEVDAAIAAARKRLDEHGPGLAPLVDQLVDALAAENATGKVSTGRALRALYQPIAELCDTVPAFALRDGIRQALAAEDGRGIPNARWVAKAATGAAGRATRSNPRQTGDHHDRDHVATAGYAAGADTY